MSSTNSFTAKEIHRISQGLPPWESMSFACGGWLQFYMFGVAKALQYQGLDKGVKYAGCSAGALAAVGLILEGDFDDAISFCKNECLPEAYGELTGLFRLNQYVNRCLNLYLIHKYQDIPDDMLQIAVTKVSGFRAERVKVHKSKEDLVLSLLSSCAAFPFSPLITRDGSWYIDGGLTDFQPVIDEDTITVSPFYFSDCDIKPSRYVPLWWTFMPPKDRDTVDWLYSLGWHDCIQYVKSRGIPFSPHGGKINSPVIDSKNSHEFDTPRRVRYKNSNDNNLFLFF